MGRTQQSILSFFGKPRAGARPPLRGAPAVAAPPAGATAGASAGNGGSGSGGGASMGGWGGGRPGAASRVGGGGVAPPPRSLAVEMDDDMPDDAQLLATLEMVESQSLAGARLGVSPAQRASLVSKRSSGLGISEEQFLSPARPPQTSRALVFGSSVHKRVLADKQPAGSPKKARVESCGAPTFSDDDAARTGRSPSLSVSPVTPRRRLRRTRGATAGSDSDSDFVPEPMGTDERSDDDDDLAVAAPRIRAAGQKMDDWRASSRTVAAERPVAGVSAVKVKLESLPPMSAADRAAVRERLMSCASLPGSTGTGGSGVAQVDGEDAWSAKNGWSVVVRDSAGRPTTHPDYDETTLYVPPKAVAGLTPFQKQFWDIKRHAYHVIIFFKKGKFYEMYDKDADVVHKELGLNYTGGGRVDMRCCGVPEQAFERHALRLLDLGYKVGRVEQTETINAATKRRKGAGTGGSAANRSAVCERSLVRVLTRSTVSDDFLLKDHHARYLLAIVEDEAAASSCGGSGDATPVNNDGEVLIGVCYVDAAAGAITVGEFLDDYRRAGVDKLLTYLSPPEILVDGTRPTSARLSSLLRWAGDTDSTDVVRVSGGFSTMTPARLQHYLGGASAGSAVEAQRQQLHRFFLDRGHVLASRAMGACADYLASLKVDAEVLSMGNFTLLPSPRDELPGSDVSSESDACSRSILGAPLPVHMCASTQDRYDPSVEPRAHMVLDAASLLNLEVLETGGDRSESGALISFVDRAVSAGGKRLLRRWLAEPLLDPAAINDRYNAIDFLHAADDASGSLLSGLRKQLSQLPDLTRALAKTHAAATVADNAVMFDNTNQRRVKEFISVLNGLQSALDILDTVSVDIARHRKCNVVDNDAAPRRLEWLVTSGAGVPESASAHLAWFFDGAFDFAAARKDGDLFLQPGAVASYDERKQAVADVEARLNAELAKHKTALRESGLKYFHRPKEPYQIEVPTACVQRSNLPRSWVLKSQSKTAQRYWTPEVERLANAHIDAMEQLEVETKTALRSLLARFDGDAAIWSAVARAVSELDALLALAVVSRPDGTGPMCRPTIVLASQASTDGVEASPVLHARSLRHPVLACRMNNNFVPNDVLLGTADGAEPDDAHPLAVVVTGSNMGGKSTLLRQTCVAAILAQMGCFVPAKSFTLTPVDRIFTRLGAHDRITRGQSTFAVEMEETATILSHATSQSLVIVDELGRGTSTHDGYAIAHAVLCDLTRRVRCRTLFATHYHLLTESFAADRGVALYKMAIRVDDANKDITFLYCFTPGVAPASFGIHCARLAGIPADVADHADASAKEFEETLARQLADRKEERLVESLALSLRGGVGSTALNAIFALVEAGRD
ncbi:hypothetical protein MMPV_000327 [Pyropia vietnamensis]